jgi:hypothetical protein
MWPEKLLTEHEHRFAPCWIKYPPGIDQHISTTHLAHMNSPAFLCPLRQNQSENPKIPRRLILTVSPLSHLLAWRPLHENGPHLQKLTWDPSTTVTMAMVS